MARALSPKFSCSDTRKEKKDGGSQTSPSFIAGLDTLVVHGCQFSSFEMSKGTFPLRTSKINVEGATKAATNGTINKETDKPTFIGDIDVSSQLGEYLNSSKEKKDENFIHLSSSPLKAIFQIGRSDSSFIDFKVTRPFNLRRNSSVIHAPRLDLMSSNQELDETKAAGNEIAQQNVENESINSVSHFALRIAMNVSWLEGSDGTTHYFTEGNVFSGGFDSNFKVRLGDSNKIWWTENRITKTRFFDGFPRNPVLVLKDKKNFKFGSVPSKARSLNEVSVQGKIYSLVTFNGRRLSNPRPLLEDNKLVDGSMIFFNDGALLWRTAAGIAQGPTRGDIHRRIIEINERNHRCPVTFSTLTVSMEVNEHARLELLDQSSSSDDDSSLSSDSENLIVPLPSELLAKKPKLDGEMDSPSLAYVYVKCGHVQGKHRWDKANADSRKCPLCFEEGSITSLKMGYDPLFWVDKEAPTHFFQPCGHMASEKTIKYWLSIPIPKNNLEFNVIKCPFCGTEVTHHGYQKLFFP